LWLIREQLFGTTGYPLRAITPSKSMAIQRELQ
jgi:hypothetical protein